MDCWGISLVSLTERNLSRVKPHSWYGFAHVPGNTNFPGRLRRLASGIAVPSHRALVCWCTWNPQLWKTKQHVQFATFWTAMQSYPELTCRVFAIFCFISIGDDFVLLVYWGRHAVARVCSCDNRMEYWCCSFFPPRLWGSGTIYAQILIQSIFIHKLRLLVFGGLVGFTIQPLNIKVFVGDLRRSIRHQEWSIHIV